MRHGQLFDKYINSINNEEHDLDRSNFDGNDSKLNQYAHQRTPIFTWFQRGTQGCHQKEIIEKSQLH